MFWFPLSADRLLQIGTDTDSISVHGIGITCIQCMTRELVNSSVKKPSNTIYIVGWVWLGCYQISIFARPVVGFFFGCWLVGQFFLVSSSSSGCCVVLLVILGNEIARVG